jgi:hypothetical protein
MDTIYFTGDIVNGLEDICCPEGRNTHQRKVAGHFDNASKHNTRTVIEELERAKLERIELRATGSLNPCDFFAFGYVKEQLKGRRFAEG